MTFLSVFHRTIDRGYKPFCGPIIPESSHAFHACTPARSICSLILCRWVLSGRPPSDGLSATGHTPRGHFCHVYNGIDFLAAVLYSFPMSPDVERRLRFGISLALGLLPRWAKHDFGRILRAAAPTRSRRDHRGDPVEN